MRLKGLVLVLIVSGIWACGSKSASVTQPQAPIQKPVEATQVKITGELLLGSWVLPCQPDPDRTEVLMNEYLQFDGDSANRITTWFLGLNCTQPLYQQSLKSDYLFSATGIYSETRKNAAFIPYSSLALSMFTAYGGFCGTKEWNANEEKKFTEVEKCSIDRVVKFDLQASTIGTVTELQMRECEKKNPSDCVNRVYTRN